MSWRGDLTKQGLQDALPRFIVMGVFDKGKPVAEPVPE